MADKYIIHNATFNGDGTSSALATSNGGVGAWNNINIFEGTTPAFGALAAGDTVYIRSKNAANADITQTITVANNLGNAAATASSYINWIIDNGAVWPGIDGVVSYTRSINASTTLRIYNRIIAKRRGGFVIINTSVNQNAGAILFQALGDLVNGVLDWSAKTGTGQCVAARIGPGTYTENVLINWGRLGGAPGESRGLIVQVDNTTVESVMINPDIRLSDSNAGYPLFFTGFGSARGQLTVIGGEISGLGATTSQVLVRHLNIGTRFESIGLRFPRAMDVVDPSLVGTYRAPGTVSVMACDDGVGGYKDCEWGFLTSRTDSNPPTLNAFLPTNPVVPWSWRVYPRAVTQQAPMTINSVKMVTGTAGTKTIVQELLAADTMSLNRGNLWITASYQDNVTGEQVLVSTKDWGGSALETSTAAWSAVVWGAVSFNKVKLSITTPTAVKPNTPVVVTLWGLYTSATANEIFFVDPDFGIF